MEKINLFILDMTNADNTSGVDRYMETLAVGLKKYPDIVLCWVQLRHDNSVLFHRRQEEQGYLKVTLPLPQRYREIIAERFWIRKYNQHVFYLIRDLFTDKPNCILHIHTLNLIDLALCIKEQVECKIVTHLHCIPWKDWYNTNRPKFNVLYKRVYEENGQKQAISDFVTNNCEFQAYRDADRVICVTRCAASFLKNTMQLPPENMVVIPNGANECATGHFVRPDKKKTDIFHCLYVGVLTESKGLNYILQALRLVGRRGYQVSLTIAGRYATGQDKRLKDEYDDLDLRIVGRIPFTELADYYKNSDVGLIASLQEQASYVAIEMAMFGLPLITTAVDGLDEMFTDGEDALKVDVSFSRLYGLEVDVPMLADCLVRLIENGELRKRLGENVRKLYENKLTSDRMTEQTVAVYKKMKGNGK